MKRHHALDSWHVRLSGLDLARALRRFDQAADDAVIDALVAGAVAYFERHADNHALELAMSYRVAAWRAADAGDHARAETLAERSLAVYRAIDPPPSWHVSDVEQDLARYRSLQKTS